MRLVVLLMVLLFLGASACGDNGSPGPEDSGTDAGIDAGTDAGMDAGFDAGDDDAGLDAADEGFDGGDGAVDGAGDATDEDVPLPKNWDELIWDQDLWG